MDDADIGDWGKAEDITSPASSARSRSHVRPSHRLTPITLSEAGVRHLIERIDVAIAVDTEDGLIVPVIRNVAQRDVRDLRAGLDRLRRGCGRSCGPTGGAERRDDHPL